MRTALIVGLLVLVIVGTINAEQHRFCGGNDECKHDVECCLKGAQNGYHECLPNPNITAPCPLFIENS
jgi:hypothetical protein